MCQEARSLWRIGQNLPNEEREKDRDQPFDEEDPLPTAQFRSTIEFLDAVGEEAGEGARERGGDVKDGHAALDFVASVPEREKEGCCGEEARLWYCQ